MLDYRHIRSEKIILLFAKAELAAIILSPIKSIIYNLKSNVSSLTSKIYPLFSVFCFLLSCSPSPLDKPTLITYLNNPDNGLVKTAESGSYKLSLTYRPTDLLVEQELFGDTMPTAEKIDQAKQQYGQYHYFTLALSAGDNKDALYRAGASPQEFSQRLTRINFQLADYIYAIQDKKDTLYLADYYVPNLYGMGGSTQILLAFPRKADAANKELKVHIQEFGIGIGEQRFVFDTRDIERIPQLNLSSNTLNFKP